MKRAALTLVMLAAAVVPVVAQKIDTETSDRTRIVHLKTALNHLTVIEVSEPVVQVAAGSPSFKVEWRETRYSYSRPRPMRLRICLSGPRHSA
jgi:hypothetical protein